MKLSKSAKILLAIATILPLIYMALFFASFALMAAVGPEKNPIFNNFGIFMVIHLGVILLMFALLAFYIVFLFKTNAVKTELKALWAVVLFFGGPIAMPIYWYLYVWRADTAPAASGG